MANIKYSEILVRKKRGYSRVKCSKCHKIKRIKHMYKYKGKTICSNCKPHIIGYKGVK